MEAALADSKKALEEGGAERLNDAFNRLQTASHKLAEVLYQQQSSSSSEGTDATTGAGRSSLSAAAPGTGQQAGSSTGGADDNVIDAEYVDVDDKK
ncbi:MAG: hypothetical protein WKF84_28990 [Pyrinomonadaceae bacterium]